MFQDGILLNALQVFSMLPHFAYMSSKLLPIKTSDLQPVWMSCSRTSMPSSSAPKPGHAFSNPTKVNLWGLNPSHCICWKSCIAFSGCQSFAYFVSFLFREKMCNFTVPGAIAAISAATHGGVCWSSRQSPPCVFLCGKSGYLSFVYNQKSQSSWDQPCILHIPGIIRTEKAALTFSISMSTTTIPPVWRTWKNFWKTLDHGKIATKREQQD